MQTEIVVSVDFVVTHECMGLRKDVKIGSMSACKSLVDFPIALSGDSCIVDARLMTVAKRTVGMVKQMHHQSLRMDKIKCDCYASRREDLVACMKNMCDDYQKDGYSVCFDNLISNI